MIAQTRRVWVSRRLARRQRQLYASGAAGWHLRGARPSNPIRAPHLLAHAGFAEPVGAFGGRSGRTARKRTRRLASPRRGEPALRSTAAGASAHAQGARPGRTATASPASVRTSTAHRNYRSEAGR